MFLDPRKIPSIPFHLSDKLSLVAKKGGFPSFSVHITAGNDQEEFSDVIISAANMLSNFLSK